MGARAPAPPAPEVVYVEVELLRIPRGEVEVGAQFGHGSTGFACEATYAGQRVCAKVRDCLPAIVPV